MDPLIVLLMIVSLTHIYGFENLALGGHTWQQHPFSRSDSGENAVDGLYDDRSLFGHQCTLSDNSRYTAEWRVDLGSVVSISHVNIFYRTDNLPRPTAHTSRMAGYFLYVSNTTSKEDGHLCFHEIQTVNRTPSEDQIINCSIHGRYVIYYNERNRGHTYPSFYSEYAYNDLCEVEVYGCRKNGYFGDTCTLQCPPNCQERRCDIHTGHCLGCLPGYQGPSCNKVCNKQTYGLECAHRCGRCENNESCHNVNGTCLRGCEVGVQGDRCQNECQIGYYGKNCIHRCSAYCYVTSRCDRFTGECDGGCKPGWIGNTCKEKCKPAYFGPDCSRKCGQCLRADECNNANGICSKGCSDGFKGDYCKEVCPSRFFGPNCSFTCSNYCEGNGTCNHVTGICNEGCKEGLNGRLCGKGTSTELLSCFNSTPFVLCIVIAFIIVLSGTVMNCLFWKRNNDKILQNSKDQAMKKKTDVHEEAMEEYTELEKFEKPIIYGNT